MGSNLKAHRRAVSGAFGCTLAMALFAGGSGSATAQDISVMVDEAHLLRLDRPGTEIVVGNPSIADIAVQNGKLLVITGKSFGMTNVIALDASGREILNRKVRVSTDSQRVVTLYKGKDRQTLDCHTRCETALVPGDVATHFEPLSKSVRTKFGIAQSALDGGAGVGAQ